MLHILHEHNYSLCFQSWWDSGCCNGEKARWASLVVRRNCSCWLNMFRAVWTASLPATSIANSFDFIGCLLLQLWLSDMIHKNFMFLVFAAVLRCIIRNDRKAKTCHIGRLFWIKMKTKWECDFTFCSGLYWPWLVSVHCTPYVQSNSNNI